MTVRGEYAEYVSFSCNTSLVGTVVVVVGKHMKCSVFWFCLFVCFFICCESFAITLLMDTWLLLLLGALLS